MDNEEDVVNLFDETSLEQPEIKADDTLEQPEDDGSDFVMPEKFEGKSIEDVITSYTNLESEYGRKNNEVGELRKLTDDILRNQVTQGNAADEFINESVEDDFDFFDDPSAAVDKALANNPRLQRIEEQMLKEIQETSHAELIALHSDADEVVASDGFGEFIKASPSRLKMLQAAHNTNDVSMASDLLLFYKQQQGTVNEDAIAERDATASSELKAASVEKGRPNASSKPTYRRAELIRLKVSDPNRYAKMSKEIMSAYADGRVK